MPRSFVTNMNGCDEIMTPQSLGQRVKIPENDSRGREDLQLSIV
jgi:hypothetical protein